MNRQKADVKTSFSKGMGSEIAVWFIFLPLPAHKEQGTYPHKNWKQSSEKEPRNPPFWRNCFRKLETLTWRLTAVKVPLSLAGWSLQCQQMKGYSVYGLSSTSISSRSPGAPILCILTPLSFGISATHRMVDYGIAFEGGRQVVLFLLYDSFFI